MGSVICSVVICGHLRCSTDQVQVIYGHVPAKCTDNDRANCTRRDWDRVDDQNGRVSNVRRGADLISRVDESTSVRDVKERETSNNEPNRNPGYAKNRTELESES